MPANFNEVQWIASNGGPLILLPERFLPAWLGNTNCHKLAHSIDAASPMSNVLLTDYERACQIRGYLGLLSVDEGKGLVLNDQPLNTTWRHEHPSGDIMIIRLYTVPAEISIEDVTFLEELEPIPDNSWQSAGVEFPIPEGPLWLFDATYTGNETMKSPVEERIVASIQPGVYSLSTALYKPYAGLSLLLHRLTK